jgi:hypothetical protein
MLPNKKNMIEPDKISVTDTAVLVFRSNINSQLRAVLVCRELAETEGIYALNVDLEDHENILRVECHPGITAKSIEKHVRQLGFECAELED